MFQLGVPFLKKMAYASEGDHCPRRSGCRGCRSGHGGDPRCPGVHALAELVDLEKEKARLEKELKKTAPSWRNSTPSWPIRAL